MLIFNTHQISAGAMTADIVPSAIDAGYADIIGVFCVWTGTPAGNILVQVSNDNSNWITVKTQAAGGAAGSLNYEPPANYVFYRVKYQFTSSTGTLDVYVSGKGHING